MMMFVFGRAGGDFNESGLEGIHSAQEAFDALDFAHTSVRRLDRAVAEVFFHPEHVDPGFGEWEADGHVFAWDLAILAADVAGHQNVRFKLYFVARYAESCPHLERKLAVLGRPYAEAQQFDVARIRRPESNPCSAELVCCESSSKDLKHLSIYLLDSASVLELGLVDAVVEFHIFQPDPLFRDDWNNVVSSDYFFALPGQVIDTQFHIRQPFFFVRNRNKKRQQFFFTNWQ